MAPLNFCFVLLLLTTSLSHCQTLQLGEWQQIQYTGATIPGRRGQAGSYIASTNEYLVFCGWYLSAPIADFYSIDMMTKISTKLALGVNSSPGIRGFTAGTSDVDNLYVFGGSDNRGGT
jgi:hypothetical protein